MTEVVILHENADWLPPFRAAFDAAALDQQEWFLDGRALDLSAPPPDAVFYSRMSASHMTRGNVHAPQSAAAIFDWLALHDRPVVNGAAALRLELSKWAQHAALAAAGVATPRTLLAVGRERVEDAAAAFGDGPFILKPNRGGKGLGVRLIQDIDDLRARQADLNAEASADDLWLAQEYCPSPDGALTRLEFIGGDLHYAVRVNAGGAFELCPAEACAIGDAPPMFQITDDYDEALAGKLKRFLKAADIQIAGVEYLTTADGRTVVYDVNTNTNYNPEAEAIAGVTPGPVAVAEYLEQLSSAQSRMAA